MSSSRQSNGTHLDRSSSRKKRGSGAKNKKERDEIDDKVHETKRDRDADGHKSGTQSQTKSQSGRKSKSKSKMSGERDSNSKNISQQNQLASHHSKDHRPSRESSRSIDRVQIEQSTNPSKSRNSKMSEESQVGGELT